MASSPEAEREKSISHNYTLQLRLVNTVAKETERPPRSVTCGHPPGGRQANNRTMVLVGPKGHLSSQGPGGGEGPRGAEGPAMQSRACSEQEKAPAKVPSHLTPQLCSNKGASTLGTYLK